MRQTAAVLTDHGYGAQSLACSYCILQSDRVAAAVLSLGLGDGEVEVSAGAVGANLLISLQLLVVLAPGDGGCWLAAVATLQGAHVSYLHHHLVSEVQVQVGRF